MQARLLAFGLLLVLLPASAAATTPAPPPPPLIGFTLGSSVVRDRRLTVRPAGGGTYRLTLEFEVVARGELTLDAAFGVGELTVDGQPTRAVTLASGQVAQVRVDALVDMRPRVIDDSPFFMLADPLWARHVLLAPRSMGVTSARYEPGWQVWHPFDGGELVGAMVIDATLEDELTLEVDGGEVDAPAQVAGGRQIELRMRDQSGPAFQWVRSGGPVLGLGAYFDRSGNTRFAMRAAYELGVTDWMIIAGAIESDFDRQVSLSLMLEGATPNALFLIVLGLLSVSTGVGAVLEITDQTTRGAVRFVAGLQAAPVGAEVTVDYFPEGNEVVTAVMGRVSL